MAKLHLRVVIVLLATALGACSSNSNAVGQTTTSNSGMTSSTVDASGSATGGGFALGVELAPGTYTSKVFATPVTFTVPSGWKVFEDEPGQFGLARMVNDGPPLLVLRDIYPADVDCVQQPDWGVGQSAEDLTSWLADHDGLVTSDRVAVTIGGLEGYVIDVELDSSWTEPCPFSNGQPMVMTVVGSEISRGLHWGVDPNAPERLWILDLPSGGNVVILADACCGVSKDEQWEAAQTVVESFELDTSD